MLTVSAMKQGVVPINQIICGDTITALKQLPEECISLCMFSPPYWSQRDYKTEGQWGLEKTYQEWLEHMWSLMDEVWRVLRKDGTVWVNLGDKYGGSKENRDNLGVRGQIREKQNYNYPKTGFDKSLLLLPERFAIGCLERGWTIPNKIIWHKRNPMPSSGKGRFTNTWEHLFFMVKNTKPLFFFNSATRKMVTKKPSKYKLQINRDWRWKDETKRKKITLWRSEDYFFDLDAVRRPITDSSIQRYKAGYQSENQKKSYKEAGLRSVLNPNTATPEKIEKWASAGKNPGDVIQAESMGSPRARQWRIKSAHNKGENPRDYDRFKLEGFGGVETHSAGANPGDVITDPTDFWTIPTQPSKLAHYASYPEKLCLTPLKAGCPRWICKQCGMPRVRVTKPSEEYQKRLDSIKGLESGNLEEGYQHYKSKTKRVTLEYFTLGWSFCSCLCPVCGKADCKCGAKWRVGIVLDPFGGTGKTCMVAKKLGLDWIYIDLKEEYCKMAVKEIARVQRQEEMF